jgi:hypothetical protein
MNKIEIDKLLQKNLHMNTIMPFPTIDNLLPLSKVPKSEITKDDVDKKKKLKKRNQNKE